MCSFRGYRAENALGQFPHGTIVCWICGDVCVDEQFVPASTVETCGVSVACQRVLAVWKYCRVVSPLLSRRGGTKEVARQICVAIELGTDVPVFIWDMHRVFG